MSLGLPCEVGKFLINYRLSRQTIMENIYKGLR
jgi:hypothetical protein